MAITYKLQDVDKIGKSSLFFDANIIIYLFWPSGRYFFEENYAKVFKYLLKNGNTLCVDFLVISEVINRILREEHKKINPTQKFKDFRNSQDGKETIKDIYTIVEDTILNQFKIIEKPINKQYIQEFLQIDELDFIDKAIVSLCKENSLILITNDTDFKNSNLDILTGNLKIIN